MRARELIEGPMPAAPPPTKAPPGQPVQPPVRRTTPNRPDPFRRIHPGVKPHIKPKGIAGPAADGREMAMPSSTMPAMGESAGQRLARHLLDEA